MDSPNLTRWADERLAWRSLSHNVSTMSPLRLANQGIGRICCGDFEIVDMAVYIERDRLSAQPCYGRPMLSRLHWGVLVHYRCEFGSDLRFDSRCFFPCVGRLKRVLCACSEKNVCGYYGPSPLCISCVYRLLASMAVVFRESSNLPRSCVAFF